MKSVFNTSLLSVVIACMPQLSTAAEESGEDFVTRLLLEYPAAAKRLAGAVRSVESHGRYTTIGLNDNSGASTIDGRWINFHIICSDKNIFWERTFDDKRKVLQVVTDHHAFRLGSAPNATDYQIITQGIKPDAYARINIDILVRRFINSAFLLWDFRSLLEAIDRRDIIFETASLDPHDRSRIKFHVRYQHRDTTGRADPSRVGSGILTLSPENDWAICGFDYNWPYAEPYKVTAKIDVQRLDHLGVVPRQYEFISLVAPTRAPQDWKKNEEYRCEIQSLVSTNPTPSQFELSQFGISEPWQSKSLLIWGNLTVVVILVTIIFLRRTLLKGKSSN